jgi:sortase A
MDHMGLGTTTPRTPVTIRMVCIVASLLFVLGSWLIGQGLWIHVKAVAAQWLLQNAWDETLKSQQPIKPWPWADTWPVGRLIVPRLGINQIILADASGRSLAFGPGQLSGSMRPGEPGTIVVSGHRDTHFQFLQQLQEDDLIYIEWPTGHRTSYTVQELTVVDSRYTRLTNHAGSEALILTTCFPFDAIVPGGPLRYVVMAEKYQTSRIKDGKKNEPARTSRAEYETVRGEYVEP